MGRLESGLDFHVSKDEEGEEGKSVILVWNGALKAALASPMKALGMRVVSHTRILGIDTCGGGKARQRKTQYGRLAKIKKRVTEVQFNRKYGAITSKIVKAGLMPSGLHGMRCMGMPQASTQGVRSGGDWRCTSATRFTRPESSPLQHGRRLFGSSSWVMRSSTRRGGGSNDWWA